MSKSIIQNVLMSDPTLRTLFWLEAEEKRKKQQQKKLPSAAGRIEEKYKNMNRNTSTTTGGTSGSTGTSGEVVDDQIDFARVAQLMRQYRTTRNAITGETEPSSYSHSSSTLPSTSPSLLMQSSRIVDSDSDGDFPDSPVSGEGYSDQEEDDDSVDSTEFYDTVARKPILKVRMGESKRLNSSITGSTTTSTVLRSSVLKSSTYGGSSKMMKESGLFHSTTSGLLRTSTATATGANTATSQVYTSGYTGSVYATATPPLALSARLHIQAVDVVFTHLTANSVISALMNTTTTNSSSNTTIPTTTPVDVLRLGRDELCIHMEETVLTMSTIYTPSTSTLQHPYSNPSHTETARNTVSVNISTNEVQLFEQYKDKSYHILCNTIKQKYPTSILPLQRQVFVSLHSLKDSRRIYASPHINASIEYTPSSNSREKNISPTDLNKQSHNCANIKATITIEPIIASFSIVSIEYWVVELSKIPSIAVADEESSTNITCSVNLSQVEVFLHSDSCVENYATIAQHIHTTTANTTSTSGSTSSNPEEDRPQDAYTVYWDTVLDALDLTTYPGSWIPLQNHSPSAPYYHHLTDTRGGFRFLLHNICIKLTSSARIRNRLLNESANLSNSTGSSSAEKRCKSNESMLHSIEMTKVALYVYVSLPQTTTSNNSNSSSNMNDSSDRLFEKERRHFYNTLMVQATSDETGKYKVILGRTNPHSESSIMRLCSEESQDSDYVLLRDADKTASNLPTNTSPLGSGDTGNTSTGGSSKPSRTVPTSAAQSGGDQGPPAPEVSPGNLVYISAYHIQVDIKQREYNALMMVADTISPKPSGASDPTAATVPVRSDKPTTTTNTTAASSKGSNKENINNNMKSSTTSSTSTTTNNTSTGFGFILSSNIATICLSDNPPHQFSFPELDQLIAEAKKTNANQHNRTSSTNNTSKTHTNDTKSYSLCVSIIEPSIEVLISKKDIYLSIKADDLSVYEMELAQFHDLVHSGFDFNQTTGREARYGSSKHLIPFIRRASLHALDVGGTEKKETFSTLLGDNQDYGRAFEVRLLLSSTTATSSSTSTTTNTTTSTGNNPVISTTEMKSVHFFIDFYDIMLSYDPQSTWILSIANMLTPQTPAQILCHRQVQRLAAVEQRYHQLTAEQQIALGCSLEEIIQNFTAETSSNRQHMETQNRQQPMESSIHSNNSSSSHTENNKKPIITLNLPFELTKINVRVRNCIIDYCCYPVNSRTFLTIGLLTVTSTIASNSQRFSLKFKVGGLSLYISNTLPLLTDSTTTGTSTTATTTRSRYRKKPSHNNIPRAELFPTTATTTTTTTDTVPMSVPVEIYEEDINHFFHTHCFIALASVDHIDVLVTINNSVQEALVIQITIGQCSIHACVDSLDLFTKTMKEWFEEFQIACEKSEAVMQKQKASSKPGRDLAVSQYAFQAPTNNLLDDDTFDTIRFCDTIPTAVEEGGGDGSSNNAHIATTTATSTSTTAAANVVPRVVIEDMSMADLIARTEREGRHVRSGKKINYQQQQAHSATMLASDMNALLVEDYYQGLSLSAEPTQTTSIQNKLPYIEGKTDQFPHREPDHKAPFTNTVAKESEDYYLEHNTENISKASVKSVQEVPILHTDSSSGKKKSSAAHLEPHFIPQYDYEMDYDFDGTDGAAAPTETLAVEPEGVGGFYADGAVEDLGEMEAESVYDEGEYQDSDDASQEDNKLQDGEGDGLEAAEIRSSTESVQSIELDDDEDDSPNPLSESNISQSYSTKEENAAAEQLSQSVFGLGNFSYWAATAAASNKPLEEFELKDFNPANIELRNTLSPVVSTANLPFAYNPNIGTTAAGTVVGTGVNAPPLYVQVGKNNTTEDTEPGWLQDELSASIHTDGSPRMAQIVTATSHSQNRDFADNSDPEDEIGEDIWKAVPSEPHTTESPPDEEGETGVGKEGEKEMPLELTEVSYEADFGLEEEVNFLPDFGEDDSAQQQEAVPTTIATGSSGKSTSSDHVAAVIAEESGQAGWKKFPEGMASSSYSPTSSLSPRQPQEDTSAAIAAHSVEQPVISASAPTAAVAVLDNLDRAWQQQPGDYIYDPNQAAAAVAAASTTTILQQQQQQIPITHDVSYKLAQLGLNPTDKASINAVPAPVVGLRKASAGQSMQRMEVAQWYENPEVLEILPHYIPVVSRSEDLDDNRPAEEQSLPTKMLMKLKGTFKIRLFQGNDWRTSPPQQAGGHKAKDADVDTMKKATGSGDSNMQQHSVSSTTAAVTDKGDGTGGSGGGKSVRFCKEDLLRDLTTPPPTTSATAAAATAKPSSNVHRPATSSSTSSGRSSGGSRGSSKPSSHSTTATSRPPRSQRPLFEETYSTGNKTEYSGDTDTKKSDQQRKSKEKEQQQLLLPRQEREMLDTTFKDLFFCIRLYENSSNNSHNMPVIYSLPSQRIVCSALDFLVSFGHVGMRRKKVLGSWTSLKRPRDTLEPVLRFAFLAYENPPLSTSNSNSTTAAAAVEADLEHRLYVRILPLRCYLDEQIILFAKSLAATSTSTATSTASNTTTDTTTAVAVAPSKEPYFQSIMISAVELKIDYRASTVNITALHQGDYLQMLNIFPLDGLEITLKHVKLNGIQGIPTFLHQLGEFWVKDIYANQLHRVISGTAPFRGLSNIGHDLHELLAIPLSDYRKTGGTMKHLRRSTRTLVRTVTRETLHATQQLTMFVANAITELASDSPVTKSPVLSNGNEGRVGGDSGSSTVVRGASTSTQRRHHHSNSGGTSSGGDHQQPAGVMEGLQQAYGSVAREVGSAAETVIAIPIREYVHTGPGGYLKSVIRALPIAVLRPVAGVMEGISYTMLGLRNDLDPGARMDEEDIWNVDIGTAAFPGSPVRISNANYQMNNNTTTTTTGSTTTGAGNRTTSSSSSSTSKSNTAGRNSSSYK